MYHLTEIFEITEIFSARQASLIHICSSNGFVTLVTVYSPELEFFINLWRLGKNSKNRVVEPARRATRPVGIGSLESILGLLKSKKNLGSVFVMLAQTQRN
jgi:hypothetical protein